MKLLKFRGILDFSDLIVIFEDVPRLFFSADLCLRQCPLSYILLGEIEVFSKQDVRTFQVLLLSRLLLEQ